jgi:iron(II)-dependent oxidoreductase
MPFGSHTLGALLQERRMRELELFADLSDAQLQGESLRDVERPIWEMGHVAWFQEYWLLRNLDRAAPSMRAGDALYDSAKLYSHERFGVAYPSRDATLYYAAAILDRCVERLGHREPTPEERYAYLLCIFHEDMHAETLTFIRQTLGYPRPRLSTLRGDGALAIDADFTFCDVDVPGGGFCLGADDPTAFVFDNEKWGHVVEVAPFSISATTVTNAEFLAFVEAGGYAMKGIWGKRGREWVRRNNVEGPRFWHHGSDGQWYRSDFGELVPLEPFHPMVHVNWYEANAYCNWAQRRLPTEAEWEMAATPRSRADAPGALKCAFPWGDDLPTPAQVNMDWTAMGCVDVRALAAGDTPGGCRQMIGNVWEWTADTFDAYPGFVVDPYEEYSEPSFGKKKVLRGGSWATRSLLVRNTFRNFYMPFRNNIYAGFRTCALR